MNDEQRLAGLKAMLYDGALTDLIAEVDGALALIASGCTETGRTKLELALWKASKVASKQIQTANVRRAARFTA